MTHRELEALDEALTFLNESTKDDVIGDVDIKVFGRVYNIQIKTNRWENEYSRESHNYDQQIQAAIKLSKVVSDISLYNYLYTLNKNYFRDEINTDPYYNGKQINSGSDLMKSIDFGHKNTKFYVDPKTKVIYFCGEYWPDEEHGFSITFPNGKFVKGKPGERTVDKNWIPIATAMGLYADAF